MSLNRFTGIAFILLASTSKSTSSSAQHWLLTNYDLKLTNEQVIQSTMVASVLECGTICGSISYCMSANCGPEEAGRRICELHQLSGVNLQPDSGWIFLHKERLVFRDCSEIHQFGISEDGVYEVDPDGQGSFEVYCVLNPDRTDGSGQDGCTVFQRRVDSTIDFYRNWANYTTGFGSITDNYWLGLERLYRLTSVGQFKLHVYLETFDGHWSFALYNSFQLTDNGDDYRLTLSSYEGTAGESMIRRSNGMQFTTFDHDNDLVPSNCAVMYTGAWWYSSCLESNLNGVYIEQEQIAATGTGIMWFSYRGFESLKTSDMKLCP